mmetsp:Transcript_53500/g.94397  ORF Transcript_53500/g.94397 Transcript_53500/m.94397 type:complete len:198 (-) Transcript_53500:38-631(-)
MVHQMRFFQRVDEEMPNKIFCSSKYYMHGRQHRLNAASTARSTEPTDSLPLGRHSVSFHRCPASFGLLSSLALRRLYRLSSPSQPIQVVVVFDFLHAGAATQQVCSLLSGEFAGMVHEVLLRDPLKLKTPVGGSVVSRLLHTHRTLRHPQGGTWLNRTRQPSSTIDTSLNTAPWCFTMSLCILAWNSCVLVYHVCGE